jgi:hypothetical protein
MAGLLVAARGMDAGPENQVRRHVARQGILPVVDFMDPKNGWFWGYPYAPCMVYLPAFG